MTVANNYAPIRQLGDNSTVQYSANWSMIAAAYAVVALESVTTGVRTPLSPGLGANQYQIVITSSGFTVTLGQPATSANYVDVSRATSLDQNVAYRTSKGFEGEVEENSFDKLTAMVQDARYTAGLAIQIPSGETTTTVLPSAALRANGYLAFDSSGNATIFSGISSISISAAMSPVVQAATLALARAAMGVPGLSDANTFTALNNFTGGLKINGTAVFNKINLVKITSSGTYTPSAGIVEATAYVWGGGGAGGGIVGSGAGSTGLAGSGGAGGYSIKRLTAAQIGASQTATIGAAGAGGGSTGGAGGQTSLGSLAIANGGSGGGAGTGLVGGAPGPGAGTGGAVGDFTAPGMPGNAGSSYNSGILVVYSPSGASTLMGGGGAGPVTTSGTATAGNAATGFGAGGTGANVSSVSANANGGNGSPGIIMIVEYLSV